MLQENNIVFIIAESAFYISYNFSLVEYIKFNCMNSIGTKSILFPSRILFLAELL